MVLIEIGEVQRQTDPGQNDDDRAEADPGDEAHLVDFPRVGDLFAVFHVGIYISIIIIGGTGMGEIIHFSQGEMERPAINITIS